MASDQVEFEGRVLGVFGKSVRFQGDFWDEPQYIPLSQCEWDMVPDSDDPKRARMFIAAWLVKKNGWE